MSEDQTGVRIDDVSSALKALREFFGEQMHKHPPVALALAHMVHAETLFEGAPPEIRKELDLWMNMFRANFGHIKGSAMVPDLEAAARKESS